MYTKCLVSVFLVLAAAIPEPRNDTDIKQEMQSLYKRMGVGAIYVINLDRAKERLTRITKMLQYLEIPFFRVPAIDATSNWSSMDQDGLVDEDIPKITVNAYLNEICRNRWPAGVACALSHFKARRWMVNINKRYGLDYPAIILEDDADVSEDFVAQVLDATQKMPSDWFIWYGGFALAAGKSTWPVEGASNLYRSEGVYAGTCYALQNSKCANYANFFATNPIPGYPKFFEADLMLKTIVDHAKLKAFIAYPRLVATQCDPFSFIRGCTDGCVRYGIIGSVSKKLGICPKEPETPFINTCEEAQRKELQEKELSGKVDFQSINWQSKDSNLNLVGCSSSGSGVVLIADISFFPSDSSQSEKSDDIQSPIVSDQSLKFPQKKKISSKFYDDKIIEETSQSDDGGKSIVVESEPGEAGDLQQQLK